MVGSFVGFIFGVPRATFFDQGAGDGLQARWGRTRANTNLEQGSDWLTKILVGVTLVELGNLFKLFGNLIDGAANIFGATSSQNTLVAGSVIIYWSILGFFAAYFAARSVIDILFYLSPADYLASAAPPAEPPPDTHSRDSEVPVTDGDEAHRSVNSPSGE
jgi:hypothetical protein